MKDIEPYFQPFRKNIIGIESTFTSPYGEQHILYADWIASGRLYAPIEKKLSETFGPFVANTHTETNITGTTMTNAYHMAHEITKRHVNAGPDDVIIHAGFGMTAAVNKFQRLLGLRVPDQLSPYLKLPRALKPVVFITHMEHHSNHTSWLATIADVEVIRPDDRGVVDLNHLEALLVKHRNRRLKIGSFSACSNVTGIQLPIHELAGLMHAHGGFCFADYAASAPYVPIDMHPENPQERLDAVFFSPHKFLGGPGASGVLIFDSELYNSKVPDHPGGGTVDWTNPWGHYKFVANIEAREDGGTPGFLQAIKTSLAVLLKEEMTSEKMLQAEERLIKIMFEELENIPKLHILADDHRDRLGVFSFYVENIHYNLIVQLLNDRFGIQVRGGCSCAGTYGHYLLHVGPAKSRRIADKIDSGDLSEKPGWVRVSLHPTMTEKEVHFIAEAIAEIIGNSCAWEKDYAYAANSNEFINVRAEAAGKDTVHQWFYE